jgi:hypothetical protein
MLPKTAAKNLPSKPPAAPAGPMKKPAFPGAKVKPGAAKKLKGMTGG